MSNITTEQIRQMFAYAKKEEMTGVSVTNLVKEKVGNSMDFQPEPFYFEGRNNIPAQQVPAHIKWYNNPEFAYVGIVDDKVEYRYSNAGGAFEYYLCPVTEDAAHIALIDLIFNAWYKDFELPQSLEPGPATRLQLDRSDKMGLIRAYLQDGSDEFFFDAFSGAYDIVMVVDWREEDDVIVQYCEDILQTGHLSAEVRKADNIRGFDILIHYKGRAHNIPYTGKGADRDTTIITLNEVLQPDFDIRFCKSTGLSDTLGFLPLAAAQWAELEAEFGSEKVAKHFIKIGKTSKLFG